MTRIGSVMSWNTCMTAVICRTAGVVENFKNAILGGIIHPSRARKMG